MIQLQIYQFPFFIASWPCQKSHLDKNNDDVLFNHHEI